MGWTQVSSGSTSYANSAGGNTFTLPGGAPSAGVIEVLWICGDNVINSVSAGGGASWTLRRSYVNNQGAYLYTRVTNGSEGTTVVITPASGVGNEAVQFQRWSGGTVLDLSAISGVLGNATSSPSLSSGTLAGTGELLLAFAGIQNGVNNPPSGQSWTAGLTDSGNGPNWLFTSDGVGTYAAYDTNAGTAAVTCQATWTWGGASNSDLSTALVAFKLSGIGLSPSTLANVTVNSLCSQTVTGVGGTGPYTFAVTSGALPSWATLNTTTGLISGHAPATSGSSSFTITATDSLSATGSQAYTLNVVVPQPVGSPTGGPWQLVFNDEFDFPVTGPVTQVPDPKVWSDHLIEGDTWRVQQHTASDLEWGPHNKAGLSVSGSVLSIICRHEDPTNAASVGYDPACPATSLAGTALQFTTAHLSSRPGLAFSYGYAEARIKIPTAPDGAYHPAFWMNAITGIWNQGPEFDIQEWFEGGNSVTYWGDSGQELHATVPGASDNAFHTYGVRWTTSDVTFFFDGTQSATYTGADLVSEAHHIYLNTQVNGPDATPSGYPGTWQCDYVRVWNKTGVPAQPTGVTVSPVNGIATSGQITASFPAVSGATSYRVTAAPVDAAADGFQGYDPSSPYGAGSATGTSSPITVTGLTNGMHYYASVAAINSTGFSIESLPVPSLTAQAGTATITGAGTVTAAGTATVQGAASLTGTGTLTASSSAGSTASASLAGAGTLTAPAVIRATAALAGAGRVTVTPAFQVARSIATVADPRDGTATVS